MDRGFQQLHVEADSLTLIRIVQGDSACPWQLQRELDVLLQFRHCFHSVTHCYREATHRLIVWQTMGLILSQGRSLLLLRIFPG